MRIAVLGKEDAWNELTTATVGITWIRLNDIASISDATGADAFFNLLDDAATHHYSTITKPVFINSVATTLKEINAGKNICRINGWKGFLKRESWELAGDVNDFHSGLLSALNKKMVITPDEPGFIAARVIAMIINEAFYAKEEKVSTEEEIDTAMKLGTNYPHGPFEWARIVGLQNILDLLLRLSEHDVRYTPAAMLVTQAKNS